MPEVDAVGQPPEKSNRAEFKKAARQAGRMKHGGDEPNGKSVDDGIPLRNDDAFEAAKI